MNLTPEQREQVRLSILRYCLRPTSTGLICANLRAEGLRTIKRSEVELEIVYLADKKLLKAEEKAISPEVANYRTTAEGRDYLAQQGQEPNE